MSDIAPTLYCNEINPQTGGLFLTAVPDNERDIKFRFIRYLAYTLNGQRPAKMTIPYGEKSCYRVTNRFDLADIQPTTDEDDIEDYHPPAPRESVKQDTSYGIMGVKMILNGFPKAGLHLAERMCRPTLNPFLFQNWVGMYGHHSWTTEHLFVERTLKLLELQPAGSFVKGHLGYSTEIEHIMQEQTIGMVFIFRDLRDVVCSIRRHINQDNGQQWLHDGRFSFWDIEDKEEQLIAIIRGWDIYGGVIERWEQYAKWLEVENVLPMPFEFMRLYPQEAYQLFVRYAIGRAVLPNGVLPALFQCDLERHTTFTVDYMQQRKKSPTFIKGQVGSWREEFTPKVRQAFDDVGGSQWLVKLGYEDREDWT